MSFWDTPAGILERCGLLADEVQGRTYNNALKIYATNVGVTDFKVVGPLKATSCEWCKMHANQTVYHRGMFMPNLPRHFHCVTPETLVTTSKGQKPISKIKIGEKVLTHRGRFRAVTHIHQTFFTGELCRFKDVSATPEHPFLTKKGWIRADSINNVADILRGEVNFDAQPLVWAKTDKNPTAIPQQNLFSSIAFTFHFGIMPFTPINFNGNMPFWDGKINVINVKSKLWNNTYSRFSEGVKKTGFVFRKFTAFLNRECMTHFLRFIPLFDSSRDMSGVKLTCSLFRGHSFPLVAVEFFRRKRSPHFSDDVGNTALGDTTFFSDFSLKQSTLVKFNNFFKCETFTGYMFCFGHNDSLRTKQNNTDTYKGYVYNLSVAEDESFTVGKNRLISHNCPHILEPQRIGAAPESAFSAFWNLLS